MRPTPTFALLLVGLMAGGCVEKNNSGAGNGSGFSGIQEIRVESGELATGERLALVSYVLDDQSREIEVRRITGEGEVPTARFAVERVADPLELNFRADGFSMKVDLSMAAAGNARTAKVEIARDGIAAAESMKAYEPRIAVAPLVDLDASLANGGTGFYPTGCPIESHVWFDLARASQPAHLIGFDPNQCVEGTRGWFGTPSPLDSYHLQMTGSNTGYFFTPGLVEVRDLSLSASMTISMWIKYQPDVSGLGVANGADFGIFVNRTAGDPSKDTLRFARFGPRDAILESVSSVPGALAAGVWNHVVVAIDRSNRRVGLFVNGRDVTAAPHVFAPEFATPNDPNRIFEFGRAHVGAKFWGRLGLLQIHPGVLAPVETLQNCLIQQTRFGISTCAP